MKYSSVCILLSFVLIVLVAFVPVSAATQTIIDQKQELWNTGVAIQPVEPVGQSFIPSLSPLVAVEVIIFTQNPGQGDDTLTCRIRESSIGGTVLGAASRSLTDNFDGSAGAWIRFTFDPPLTVTPGSTYVIELDANVATFGWGEQANANPYPDGGQILYGGSPTAVGDFTFRTYSEVEYRSVGGELYPVNKVAVLAPYLGLVGLVATITSVAIIIKRQKD